MIWLYLCLKTPFFIMYTHLQEQGTDLPENAELRLANTPGAADTSFKKKSSALNLIEFHEILNNLMSMYYGHTHREVNL